MSKDNPIKTLWTILGNIGGVLALSNMATTWIEDLSKWKGFLKVVFVSYRSVVEPISRFLFGWMPFDMWIWFGDYCVFGGILVASMFKSNQIEPVERFEPRQDDKIIIVNTDKYIWKFLGVILFILMLLFWPYIFVSNVLAVLNISRVPEMLRSDHMKIDLNEYLRTIQWYGAICLGSIVLISLNEVVW